MAKPMTPDDQASATGPRHARPAAPVNRRTVLAGSVTAVVAVGGTGAGLHLFSTPAPDHASVPVPGSGSTEAAPPARAYLDRDDSYADVGRTVQEAGGGIQRAADRGLAAESSPPAPAGTVDPAAPATADASGSTSINGTDSVPPDPGPTNAPGTTAADAEPVPVDPAPGPWPGVPVDPTPDQLAHLLNRVTFGSDAVSRAEIAEIGLTAWLERQFDPLNLADPDGDAVRAALPLAFADPATVRASVPEYDWAAAQETGFATIGLQLFSSRQLFEVVVDVFANLLNVTTPSEVSWQSGGDY